MGDFKDQMAKKLQAAARGYITRKTGSGGKSGGKKNKTGGGSKNTDDMNARIIQAAFRKYKVLEGTSPS
ncbi:unnamed protein product [Scytosiphon promiscuus]